MAIELSEVDKATAAGCTASEASSVLDLISFLRQRASFLVGSDSDAWDLVQDALERVLRRWPNGWASPDARRWVTVVLRNLHIDRVRSASWRGSMAVHPDVLDWLPAPDTEELPLWKTIDSERVEAGLAQLPPADRRVLQLQVDGKSLREIGAELGINAATVGTQLFRAKRRMRVILGLPAAPARFPRPKRRSRCCAATI